MLRTALTKELLMKKTTATNKIRLHSETIRLLDADNLANVGGARSGGNCQTERQQGCTPTSDTPECIGDTGTLIGGTKSKP
jgi:hypothetical protein